jgi:hypothetical protein
MAGGLAFSGRSLSSADRSAALATMSNPASCTGVPVLPMVSMAAVLSR